MQYVLDAPNSHTDRLSRALCVCLSRSSRLRLNALALLLWYEINHKTEQDETSDMWKYICALLWMQSIKAASGYDLISNNQMANMLRIKNITMISCKLSIISFNLSQILKVLCLSLVIIPPPPPLLLYICLYVLKLYTLLILNNN